MPNWLTDLDDELDPVDYEAEMAKPAPMDVDLPDDSAFAYAEPQAVAPSPKQGPNVADFIKNKYNIGERQKILDENANPGIDWRSALSALGAGISGRDPNAAGMATKKLQEDQRNQKLSDFDKSRAAAIGEQQYGATQATMTREQDPNSDESKLAQDLAKQFGVPGDLANGITAAKFKSISPGYEKLFKIKADAAAKGEDKKFKTDMLNATRAASHSDKQNTYLAQTSNELESARGNPAVGQAEKDIYAADKANDLAKMYGDPNKLTKSQVNLLVQEVGKIASGGSPTMHELEGLAPGTLTGRLSKVFENLTNQPTPANAAAFVKQYQDYTKSLKKEAKKVIEDKYGRILESRKRQLHPDDYKALREQYMSRFDDDSEDAPAPTLDELLAEKKRRSGL